MSMLVVSAAPATFPLSINGRHLEDAQGNPFLINGDTPWSIPTQLTEAQVDTYLDDRQAKGFNAIMFNMIDVEFSNNTPAWENRAGEVPFVGMTETVVDFTNPTEAYWTHVDYIVNAALQRDILCVAQPAYLGFGGGSEGWNTAVNNESDADLQTYGAFLANRYTQGNIIWCMGGDYDPPTPAKQWNIVTGIRSVRTTDIVTAHGTRNDDGGEGEAYPIWNTFAGFNLNNIYTGDVTYVEAATAYARGATWPFFLIEAYYDGSVLVSNTDTDVRRQAYTAILSGAFGHFFGNNPIWGFGEPNACGGLGPASALSTSLNTTVTQDMAHIPTLFGQYAWETLVPDDTLVTSALGSGASRVVGALASDGAFAMVWRTSNGSSTIDMTKLTPSSVRAREFDPTDGSFSTIAGSPFPNTGTRSFTFGEGILVLDGA